MAWKKCVVRSQAWDQGTGGPGNIIPKASQCVSRAVSAARSEATCKNQGIHRTRTGPADAVDANALIIKQTIENAPGKRAVRSAALERKIDRLMLWNSCQLK